MRFRFTFVENISLKVNISLKNPICEIVAKNLEGNWILYIALHILHCILMHYVTLSFEKILITSHICSLRKLL